jgi:hypothetical protein
MDIKDILNFISEDKINLLILFTVPGFVALKIWTLIYPSDKLRASESIFELFFYSTVNYIFPTLPLLLLAKNISVTWFYIVSYVIVLLISPVLWAYLVKSIINSHHFQKLSGLNPSQTAWTYFFNTKAYYFVLVHLNDESIIGGLYGNNSYASLYPAEKDIYLEEVWKIDDNGAFVEKEKKKGSFGMLIKYDVIQYIEFFDIEGEK